RVGLGDRLARLARHLREDAVLRDRLEAAGVDDDEGLRPEPPLPVMAIAREPRQVRHQRIARAREAVEQRRLPDVGPPHDDDGGFQSLTLTTDPPAVCTSRPERVGTMDFTAVPSVASRPTISPVSAESTCRYPK